MSLWYLSHRRPVKAEANLRIRTQEVTMEVTEGRPKIRHSSPTGWLRMRI